MRNLTKHTPHILAFLLLCTPYALFAQDFVPLSPDLPGLADKNIWDVSVEEMLNGIFMILIAVGAILAVLFFAISGIQYMATESITKKGMMKEGMTRVVVGILILIGGTLALSTINPGIIKIDLFETVKTTNQTTLQYTETVQESSPGSLDGLSDNAKAQLEQMQQKLDTSKDGTATIELQQTKN